MISCGVVSCCDLIYRQLCRLPSELELVDQVCDVKTLPPSQLLQKDPPAIVVQPLGVSEGAPAMTKAMLEIMLMGFLLAGLFEESGCVRRGHVPVVDDARLLKPLLCLAECDKVTRGSGLSIAGKALKLATKSRTEKALS